MAEQNEGFCTVEEALDELRQGRMIVLVDDEHRENEGDLVIAAERRNARSHQLHDAGSAGVDLPGDVARHLRQTGSAGCQ